MQTWVCPVGVREWHSLYTSLISAGASFHLAIEPAKSFSGRFFWVVIQNSHVFASASS
jgi:hypothetical protein